jgi:WD40 repeat protein
MDAVASASWDKTVKIWDIQTGAVIVDLPGETVPWRKTIYNMYSVLIYFDQHHRIFWAFKEAIPSSIHLAT